MAEIGVDVLNPEELRDMRLQSSTNLFGVSNEMAARSGQTFRMSPVVKEFSDLNRWFIFRRRGKMALASSTETRLEVLSTMRIPATQGGGSVTAPLPPTLVIEAEAVAEPEAEAVATTVEETVEDADHEASLDGGSRLQVADGPLLTFYHKSPAKDDLKVGDKHWRRALSPYAPFTYTDPANPSVKYPSLEAALGSAKFQLATDKPELGPQLFSTAGNIAQEFGEKKRSVENPSAEQLATWVEEMGVKMRDAQKPIALRKVKAKFDEEAWKAKHMAILTEYVHQRFEGDKTFRKYLEAVGHKKARLVYYTAGGSTELSGSVKDDTVEGMNLLGKAYLREVGFRF
jgi:hypothetical protein